MKALTITLGLVACISPAFALAEAKAEDELAKQLIGTVYTQAHRETADGVLSACGVEFGAFARDFSTKNGELVFLNGSLYLRQFKNSMGYALKLSARDGLISKKPAPFAPHSAYVAPLNGNASIPVSRVLSDTPGAALWVGSMDDQFVKVFKSIVESSAFVVGFNRAPKQQDVQVEIDLSIIDVQIGSNGQPDRTRSPKTMSGFMSCTDDLFKMVGVPAK